MGLTGAGPTFTGTATPSISFADATGTLTVTDLAALANVQIKGFVSGDQINVGAFGSESFSNGVLTLYSDAAQTTAIGSLNFADTTASADVLAGVVPCYAAGTRILTTRGEIAVEALAVGDQVVLAQGGTRPVIWLGHREVACARHPTPVDVWPIRIAAHAFGANLPARDLLVSPEHAIFAQGVLIPARDLVNGHSVTQLRVDRITYWHVELDCHDVILAEGLPAESFLENDNRSDFDGADILTLHPLFGGSAGAGEPCARVVRQGPILEQVRQFLRRPLAA
jgi:hypothetical protein